jgi:hypothetical protein
VFKLDLPCYINSLGYICTGDIFFTEIIFYLSEKVDTLPQDLKLEPWFRAEQSIQEMEGSKGLCRVVLFTVLETDDVLLSVPTKGIRVH